MNPAIIYEAQNLLYSMTLDELHTLAAKGDGLKHSDLPLLRPSMLSSTMGGYNPTLYSIEGGYRLLIHFNDTLNPENGIRSTSLESIWESGGSGIDIRYSDVDAFIRANASNPALTVLEAQSIAQNHLGRAVTYLDTDWWEYADEFPHSSTDPEKQALSDSFGTIVEATYQYSNNNGTFIAIGKRYGTIYEFNDGAWSIVAPEEPQKTTPPDYSALHSTWKPLCELPADYSMEQATADGIYVNVHGRDIFNQA